MSLSNQRLRSRLLRHHVTLLAFSAATVAALYITRPYKDVVTRISFATAYPAIVLLGTTLLIGPINVLRRHRNPISSDLRRDVGIWAGLLSTLHAIVGQCVHLRGRPWLYYVYGPTEKHIGLRRDLFGFANYTGAVATLLLVVLFATSNDVSMRVFGTPRWKALQRWNYAAFGLAAIHSFGYQAIEKQKIVWVTTVIFCVAITVAIQGAGFLRRRQAVQDKEQKLGAVSTK